RAFLIAGNVAGILAGVDEAGCRRVVDEIARLAASDREPIGQQRSTVVVQGVGRPAGRAPVLNRAADVIRDAVVGIDVVELRERQGRREPGLAAIAAEVDAAVVAGN